MTLSSGMWLGPYEITGPIGSGGMELVQNWMRLLPQPSSR
jgi:hypothetical protein